MENEISYKKIEEYWHHNTISYTIFTKNTLHYGLWDENTKTSIDAYRNTHDFIAKTLQLKENDRVLDAGCGVGGVSVYFAENYGTNSTGIAIAGHQIELAKQNARLSKVPRNLEFYKQNYIKTDFQNESFDKIFGLESICYAREKIDFLKEAFRLLKPGGRILVQDAFVIKSDLKPNEKRHLKDFLEGWALPNLSSISGFTEDLKTTGFQEIEYFDKTNEIRRQIETVYWNSILSYPITWFLQKLNWIPKTVHETVRAGISQKRIIDLGVATYGTFTAIKSSKYQ